MWISGWYQINLSLVLAFLQDVVEKLNSATDTVKGLLGDNADLWAAQSRMK